MSRQTKEDIANLKDEYVKYFEDVPVQKYAAMYIGRTEETIITWKQEDEDFLNRVQEAHAKWVKKNVLKAKAEFKLERLEKDIFKESKDLEVSIPVPILRGLSKASELNDGDNI